jgi:hypothetical protein
MVRTKSWKPSGVPHVRVKRGDRNRRKYSYLGMDPNPSSGMVDVYKADQVNAVLELG